MALPNNIDSNVLMEFVAVFNHEYAGKEWSIDNFRTALNNWMKPDWRKARAETSEREQANEILPLVNGSALLKTLAASYVAIDDKWKDEKTPIVCSDTFYGKDQILKDIEKQIQHYR